MGKFLVTGGRQRTLGENINEWEGYDKAICLLLDSETLKLEPFFKYCSPKENLPVDADASITFKSASIHNNDLVVCTTTEILRVSISDRKLKSVISLPVFNDVHHVFVNSAGNYVVTSTGLDAVFEIGETGDVLSEWSVTDDDIWSKFDREVDYRRILTTKPHISHPNHCAEIDGELWVTRLMQKDLLNLNTREAISIPYSAPHDGLLLNDSAYFTHVKGTISKIDFSSRNVSVLFEAGAVHDQKESLGWCRGLSLQNEDNIIVGFTRIRPTKSVETMYWLKKKLTSSASWYGGLPTRLVNFDVAKRSIEWEVDLEPSGINAVFSILPIPEAL